MVPCLVAVLAFVIMYGPGVDFINNITSIISTLMGPIIGVIIAEFFVVSKRNINLREDAQLPAIQIAAFASLLIGVAISFLFSNVIAVPVPALMTIIATGIVHLILALGFKLQK